MEISFMLIAIILELIILIAIIYSLFAGLQFALFDLGLDHKCKKFVERVLVVMGCLSVGFFVTHLITFYPRFSVFLIFQGGEGKVDNLNRIFWAGQEVYIMKVFLPVIIGFLVLLVGLVALFIASFWRNHYQLWHLGKNEDRSDQVASRLRTVLAATFANVQFWKEPYPGAMHFLIFWGTLLIFLGKIVRLFSYIVGLTNPPQPVFLYASFVSEIGGGMVLIGGCLAIVRRYIIRPPRLVTKPDSTLIFVWGFVLLMTGYFIKGFRINAMGVPVAPECLSWAPLSYLISRFFLILPTEPLNELLVWHRVFIHAIPAFLLLAYVIMSHSPLQHSFLSPINIFFRSLKPRGTIDPIPNFEEAKTFGVREISDFTWKQLLDLEACTNCGRCQDVCPAHLSEKPLSPRWMTQNLKEHFWREGPKLLSTPVEQRQPEPIMGTSVSEDEIWACTTCLACSKQCPIFIEPMEKIVDLRRYMVLTEGKMPSEIERVYRNLEWFGNPVGMGKLDRDELIRGIRVEKTVNNNSVDFLFWVGCQGYFHERNRRTIITLIRLLQKLNLSFGVLGREETCCGDVARRTGNEYLFKKIAKGNIDFFERKGITKIVTHCPHCFNVFKNEYPQLGGKLIVSHYTELLIGLVDKILLSLKSDIVGKVAFHDSCYLSRYNGIISEPRSLLRSISSLEVVEMSRSKQGTFCCGAGGGGMWLGRQSGRRMNEMRAEEALGTKVDYVATACPYCLNMIEDGIKSLTRETSLQVLDIAELLDIAMV